MKAAIENKLITRIIIAIVSVIAIVLLSILQTGKLQDTAAAVKHTNQVLSLTRDILDVNQQYELNIKNYLLTGRDHFIDSAEQFKRGLPESLSRLKFLTADNAAQQSRIDSLRSLTTLNGRMLDSILRMNGLHNFDGVGRLIAANATIGYSYKVRRVISEIVAEESRLLEIRRAVNQRNNFRSQVTLWVLIGAVILLAFVTFQKVRLDLIRSKVERKELNRFNRELEQEVMAQTASLQASEEKYKTLFYKSPMAKWIYDPATLRFQEVNEAAIRRYGYSQEEFHQMTIRDMFPPEDQMRFDAEMVRVRASPNTYTDQSPDWRHITKTGEIISVELTAHPIEFEEKRVRMVVSNDISEQKRSQEMLRELNENLEKRAAELGASNAELERFAYIASHDLQEPLRMVSSFLQLLQKKYKGQLDAKADQYIFHAVDGADRMKILILDLLEYSRVGTGRHNFTQVNLSTVMSDLEEIFREKIIEQRARVEVGDLPVIYGDRVQLTQLLQNLIGNALKYHGDLSPVIRIAVKEVATYWKFEVQDNGIGIDPLFFDKIFIIFQRLHNKSNYSGTGIGLAICKKIVERHGGKIWVESSPGEGSRFLFTIAKEQ